MRRRHLMPGPLAGLIAGIGEVDLLLVLAMDVSHSISPEEGRLQRAGYQAALLHDQALAAIRGGRNGAIGVACVAWAGMDFQKVTVPWTRITEHKHFAPWETHAKTVCFREYSKLAQPGDTPYYPLRLAAERPCGPGMTGGGGGCGAHRDSVHTV